MTTYKTPRPVTYCIDYAGRDGHLAKQEKLLSNIAEAPPHLMHIGHDVPIPNSFGPIELSDGGGSRLLSPSEVRGRTQEIRRFLGRVRDTGVKLVIPYICNQTLAGDPAEAHPVHS